ncbi:MAG: hypothetical protein J6Y97_00170 [Prevotella sp.]|nr:hypothetical protein [Prevotella sp.]
MKKRRRHQPDPNQLLLFSEDEMSGTAMPEEYNADLPQQEPIKEDTQETGNEAPLDEVTETPQPPLHVMNSCDSVVDLLKSVMGLLDQFDDNQIRLIAMQTAALVQRGIDYSLSYHLPAIPDYEFKGDVLAGLAYVSIARSFPNMTESIGLHWSEEYREAEATYLNS